MFGMVFLSLLVREWLGDRVHSLQSVMPICNGKTNSILAFYCTVEQVGRRPRPVATSAALRCAGKLWSSISPSGLSRMCPRLSDGSFEFGNPRLTRRFLTIH
jgi:hypothetical protein